MKKTKRGLKAVSYSTAQENVWRSEIGDRRAGGPKTVPSERRQCDESRVGARENLGWQFLGRCPQAGMNWPLALTAQGGGRREKAESREQKSERAMTAEYSEDAEATEEDRGRRSEVKSGVRGFGDSDLSAD